MKCAIVTIAIGDKYIQEYNDIFRKHAEYYCQRWGYAFHLITDYSLPDKYPLADFVNIMKWTISYRDDMKQYDRIAIVDADIIITPTCPPIHELELGDKIGVVDEYSQPTPELRIEIQRKYGFETSASDYYKIHSGETIDTVSVFNGGFCICSPKLHGQLFKEMFDRRVDGTFHNTTHPFHYEQSYFGFELQTLNACTTLDNKWNTIWPIVSDSLHLQDKSKHDYAAELYNTAYIIHFCSHYEWDIAKAFTPILDSIKQRYNTYEPLNCQVELICNVPKELNRYDTVRKIADHYNIVPTYTIYGDDTRNHPYFDKFESTLNIHATSLAINHISLLEKYKDTQVPLLMFESDVLCCSDFSSIDAKLKETIQIMYEKHIDFVFLGKGCFDHIDKNNYTHVQNDLYVSHTSRCTESYLISPNGIRQYLDYFYNNTNHTAIDADYNLFFKTVPSCKLCWQIPELFYQGSRHMYTSLVPINPK